MRKSAAVIGFDYSAPGHGGAGYVLEWGGGLYTLDGARAKIGPHYSGHNVLATADRPVTLREALLRAREDVNYG